MSLGSSERGCGKRTKGGIYAEVPLDPNGVPLEHFLLEPPVELDVEELGLSPIGVKLFDRAGTTHVLDWIGEEYYPNVADMVEEIKHLGLSRRLPKTLDFSRLGPGSRIMLVHRRAFVRNWRDLADDVVAGAFCPKRREEDHNSETPAFVPCIGAWWHDLDEIQVEGENGSSPRRVMPAFEYIGWPRGEFKPEYGSPALFASFPIANLAVINDPEGKTHEAALANAEAAGLPVNVEEE